MIEGAGVPLAVTAAGAGPPVLLVHDMAADAETLAPLAADLAADALVIVYDRRGYGGSGAPVPYEATTVNEQTEDAAAVLRSSVPVRERTGPVPFCVAGFGFGALVVLDLLTRHAALLAGAVLVDPPLFAFVPEAAEALAGERLMLEDALRESGPELAVERWLGGGADPARVERARAAHRAFFADLAGLATWPVTRGALRAITVPVVVQTTPGAPDHVVAAAVALAGLIPQAQRREDGDVAAAVRAII
jgi:pimeloyl-ACP methyl ester carboxylesterase